MLIRLVIAIAAFLVAAAPAEADPPAPPPSADGHGKVQGVRTLDSFAAALGVRLGGDNDQPVFDAAEAAMKASPTGLYVRVSPGRYRLNRIRFGANSGFYAEAPQTVVLQQLRDERSAAEEAFVALEDPFATNWLFWGFTLDGGWNYGRGAYAKAPETDPWLDHQHAIEFLNAPNGAEDDKYRAKSPIGAQNPRARYGELTIANFGGDGLRVMGGGGDTISNINIFNVGGRGVQWRTYDNNAAMIDVGGAGREGFYCGPNCGSNRFSDIKIWYSGQRHIPGAAAGLVVDRTDGNQFLGFQIQDSGGDAIVLVRAHANTFVGGVQWQGRIFWMDKMVSPLVLKGSSNNRVSLNTSIPDYADQHYPAINLQIRIEKAPVPSKNNLIEILSEGLPEGRAAMAGAADPSNTITVNGLSLTRRR
jgi:hypothetical protein